MVPSLNQFILWYWRLEWSSDTYMLMMQHLWYLYAFILRAFPNSWYQYFFVFLFMVSSCIYIAIHVHLIAFVYPFLIIFPFQGIFLHLFIHPWFRYTFISWFIVSSNNDQVTSPFFLQGNSSSNTLQPPTCPSLPLPAPTFPSLLLPAPPSPSLPSPHLCRNTALL